MDKYAVAQILREIGMVIELTDDNPKKGIAYRRAALVVEEMEDFDQIVTDRKLELFPGIGQTISSLITTLVHKGSLPYYDELIKKIPDSIFELTLIPGLNLKKIRALYEQFGISNLVDLESALQQKEIEKVKGFGPSFVSKITKQIALFGKEPVLLYQKAFNIAQAFVEILKGKATRIEISGALRRKIELISEIEIVISSNNPEVCISTFANHFLTKNVISIDHSHVSVKLRQGLKATLHVSDEKEFPFVLLNTTGNSSHISALRNVGIENEIKFLENRIESAKRFKAVHNEKEIYGLFGLPFIAPELREGYGEIEAAKKGSLPQLIENKDLKGTFHCHTTYSDGHNTLEEISEAARKLGWEYIGISDHSKSSYQANGMDEERLSLQIENIKQQNDKLSPSFKIFSGVECDILKNGELDFSNEILGKLDFVIVSIHRYFDQDEETMTARLIRAIEHPNTTIVGHLTGRLLRLREPYKLNIPKIIDACIDNDKIMELNAYPNRLDMDWRLWIKAKEKGLKCCINPDAHSLLDLKNCFLGVSMARKGWLEKGDVINTMNLKEVTSYLKKRK